MVAVTALTGAGEANHNEPITANARTNAIATLEKFLLKKFLLIIVKLPRFLFEDRAICLARSDLKRRSVSPFLKTWAMSEGILPARSINSSLSTFNASANFNITFSLGGGMAPFSILLR